MSVDYEKNVYYNPAASGLSTVGEAEAGGGYDFDKFVVWRRDRDGAYLWGSDSGCSCPSPFEDIADPEELTLGSLLDAVNDLEVWVGDRDGYDFQEKATAAAHLREVLLREAAAR